MIKLTLPVRIIAEQNRREHWAVRNKRKVAQKEEVWAAWPRRIKVPLPCVVKLTRYGQKMLDDDGLVAGFKAVRDAVAKELKIDDGSNLIKFEYDQVALNKRQYSIDIEVTAV